jgi:MFS family permease
MRFRLSLLMFLNYTILGAWVPVLAPFLEQLGCSPRETAWIFATNALGAILGPVVWGQIADRWLAAEKCISICCLASGTCLWLVAESTRPIEAFWSCFFLWLFLIPVLSVGASLAFRHLRNPETEYGRVRLWGTLGWIAIGWMLTAWYQITTGGDSDSVDRADALRLGAWCGWLTGIYASTLPHTPPLPRNMTATNVNERRWLATAFDAPLQALRLIRHRSFAVLCGCLFSVYATFSLSAQLTALLLENHLGVAKELLPAVQTLAQTTEVLTLALLPILMIRLGLKGVMLLGLTAWTLALTVFSIGQPKVLAVVSLGLHGVFISCFIVAGQLYINRLAQDNMRASAQGLMQFVNGLGLLTGHFLVGWLRGLVGTNYPTAFVPGAVVAVVVLVVFAAGFRASRHG